MLLVQNMKELCLLGTADFFGKIKGAVFSSVITLLCFCSRQLVYTSEDLTHLSLSVKELRISAH